ncbi:hypothetical protein GHO42_24445 [Pseudomonas sp. FSL R10-0056]|uniref:hypothetical protein n=1 Tax=unclassified Pseudomonas TaxID=196821 RepID=UPI001296E8D8|nr:MULTISPECIES: hypothetical protein [unclassified Pseudomonas]MQT66217.1 hypothetical protein [Pseudomonas sp. FSL R10-0056]MQT71050.1 hypothetical protein [Pseudomonas sp. FSL R10-0071]MQU50540.1 hypothetical protein [Pseudomonas sp. FSL A6-1183]
MKANWILALVGAAIVTGVVVAVGVLGAYGYYLGPVSRNATDWGSFGAVMSGAFTLLSSFATIGTLLFLYLQQLKGEERQNSQDAENLEKQQKHDVVVEKQLAALTFEQYLNHRKVFIERLNEQSVFFRGDIGFADPDRVYTAMFAKNSPSHCEYKVEIGKPGNVRAYDLTDCLAIYTTISELLENYRDMEKHLTLVQKIVHLQGCLGMTYLGAHKEGDIFFMGLNAGLNIYDISKTLQRIEKVINSILFFTGNEKVASIQHKGQSLLIRDGLYKTLTEYHRAKGGFELRHKIEALPFLFELYEISQFHFIVTERILEETYMTLVGIFSRHDEIENLKNFDYADRLTDIILYEIRGAKEQYEDDPDKMNILNRADYCLWAAMKHLGVVR